jgi:hypothetical protein
MKQLQPALELRRKIVPGITDLPPSPEDCYDKHDTNYESDDWSDLGSA